MSHIWEQILDNISFPSPTLDFSYSDTRYTICFKAFNNSLHPNLETVVSKKSQSLFSLFLNLNSDNK